MKLMRRMARSVCGVLIMSVMMLSLPAPALAGMVGTGEVIAQQQQTLDRGQLLGALAQEDVRAQLVALGVNPDQAAARVAALSDEELQTLAAQMNDMPAGGSVLGVAVFIFLVLLATDILGFTDIFPFVKKTVH
ncbi:MAG: PA2779 family protein [Pseudomonadota bacterium]